MKLHKIIKKMDPNLTEDSEEFKIAMTLLGAAQCGPNADKIARYTKLPRTVVRPYVAKAREQGIFTNDNKIAADWMDKDGGIAFWLDVAVVRGFMRRV